MSKKQYWLMKSEPEVYSIEHLKKDKKTLWSGVRNYQARNFMKSMNVDDEVLFYHSSAEPPGVAGIARISKKAIPDPSQFDPKSEYYDKKASKEKPIWFCTEVSFEKNFPKLLSLHQLKNEKSLADLLLLKRGQRLSVQPVDEAHFQYIQKLGLK
ncbi:MAG: EVE domain-containing protein [Bdellovibrionota bacterium]